MPEMTESSLLCSDTAQVPVSDLNPIQTRNLDLWITSAWLKTNGYGDIASRMENCGTSFAHLKCSQGHDKYVRLHCKQDFCPKCGQKWSGPHKRRATRAMDRLIWGNVVGYMIYTLPEEVSAQRPDKTALSYLSKKAWEITKSNFDTDGAMVRTHLMGEESAKLHIHFNVLFPLRSSKGLGKVPQEVLNKVRQEWGDVINGFFELNHKQMNSYYNFVWEFGKKIHKVKYVMRAIVTTRKFVGLSSEDKHYVLSLKGWHNTRWFGKLANSQYKKYLKAQGIKHIPYSEKDVGLSHHCPICKTKFKFVDIVHEQNLPRLELRMTDKDTFIDLAMHSFLNPGDG